MRLLLILFFSVVCTFTYAQPVKTHGQLKVKGTQLTNEKGNPVVLRGMSYGWHNWWPRFYNPQTVKWLHNDWGCTVVRAALGVEPNGGYIQRPDWSKQKIKAVADGAITEGIYVIIDWHSHNINLTEAKAFFTEMATLYGNQPNVIYEIINEPDYESWQQVKEYSVELVKTIRAIDPDNIILIGSPHWDQDIHVVADDPLTGFTNIMYTVHFYAATHKQSLRNRCDYALRKGIPIFISECAGMESSGNGPVDTTEWNNWLQWMEKNRLSWLVWSVSDKNETCSVLLPAAGSEGGWTTNDLKAWGRLIRSELRTHATGKVKREK